MNTNRAYGIGGSNAEDELAKLTLPQVPPEAITEQEFHGRLEKACKALRDHDLDALYINAGTNLYYFTNTLWNPSERMVGAILLADGSLKYIVPEFEIGTFNDFKGIDGEIIAWAEHESPVEKLMQLFGERTRLGIDDTTAFTMVSRFQNESRLEVSSAEVLIRDIRMIKSTSEIAHLQYAMDLTLQVHQAAARILRPGITPYEVEMFIDKAHQKLGSADGSYFCIVLFGKDSSFPHGVKSPKPLAQNDMVLVDTGFRYKGYLSDITRTYIYGHPTAKERDIWHHEKSAQLAAFEAAQIGQACGFIDDQVRAQLVRDGLGPDYALPGLPHRTGHGIGLDIHEHPFILRGNEIKLKAGMTFSIEPMIVVPDEFGVRLEDHIYMTDNGPRWFTKPAYSIDDPFGISAQI